MAEDIYGTSIPHLKGKTVRHKIQHVEPVNITSFPQTILDKYNEVTADGDLLVLIKDVIGNTCFINGLHMLDLMLHCLAFLVWYSRPIDILSHSDILSHDWKVLQNVIINCMV